MKRAIYLSFAALALIVAQQSQATPKRSNVAEFKRQETASKAACAERAGGNFQKSNHASANRVAKLLQTEKARSKAVRTGKAVQ